MSTRSLICKELPNGKYFGIYCHSDGYLTYNGAMLLDHYSNAKKLDELIALGDISCLEKKVHPNPKKEHSFDGNRQKDVVVAYGRDRGETNIEAREISLSDALDSWCEYMYVYGLDGKWRYFDLLEYDPQLRSVEEDLARFYRRMGFERPKNEYGWVTRDYIEKSSDEELE